MSWVEEVFEREVEELRKHPPGAARAAKHPLKFKWIRSGPMLTEAEAAALKAMSDKNLVFFYRKELVAGLFSLLPRGAIRWLKLSGAITLKGRSRVSGFKLSEKGKEILKLTNNKNTRIELVGALQDPAQRGVKEIDCKGGL